VGLKDNCEKLEKSHAMSDKLTILAFSWMLLPTTCNLQQQQLNCSLFSLPLAALELSNLQSTPTPPDVPYYPVSPLLVADDLSSFHPIAAELPHISTELQR
jgi:hypothetical protein